jgi:hypothetical protein
MSLDDIYSVITSVGKFRVEKTKEHLKVGGKRFCVEIKFDDKKPDTAELQWLITKDGGCELDDKPIKDSKTVHLLYLSFTILKKYIPVKTIKLLDNSFFDCIFDDKTKTKIFINYYNYLFHGGTWYDIKTNAIPIDPTQKLLYDETKPLYNDPSIKQQFDFRNPLLQTELTPLYEKSNTWKEFADTLHNKYDKTVLCRKIAPWYKFAVAILTKNRMLPEFWIIDITKISPILYDRLKSSGGGKTRKQIYKPLNQDYTILSPSELYSKKL